MHFLGDITLSPPPVPPPPHRMWGEAERIPAGTQSLLGEVFPGS
jgi:hypothetical protein